MNAKVVMNNGKEVDFQNCTVHIYSYKKVHVIEKLQDDLGQLRSIEHGFCDTEWKEVHIYNDQNILTD